MDEGDIKAGNLSLKQASELQKQVKYKRLDDLIETHFLYGLTKEETKEYDALLEWRDKQKDLYYESTKDC